MNYEQKYKEALVRATKEFDSAHTDSTKNVIQQIFPELVESEDEKVIRWLTDLLSTMQYHHCDEDMEMGNKAIAWLEKQGEQKPADKEPSIFRDKLLELFQRFRWYCKDETPTNGDILEYVDTHIQELTDTMQKPAWSEEDTSMLGSILSTLGICSYNPDIPADVREIHKKEEAWLSELYNRIIPQPKQEWSEEDEKMVGNIRSIIEKYAFSQSAVDVNGELCEKEYIEADNWLKSLRPPYYCDNCKLKKSIQGWKPSEEQMKILNEVLNFAANHESPHWNDYIFETLNNLKRQLKKLRED